MRVAACCPHERSEMWDIPDFATDRAFARTVAHPATPASPDPGRVRGGLPTARRGRAVAPSSSETLEREDFSSDRHHALSYCPSMIPRGVLEGMLFRIMLWAQRTKGLCASKRDRVGDRPRSGSHRVPVVAALNDPLTVFLADNFSDVMPPDDDRADRWSAGVRSIAGPRPRQIECRAGIAAHLPAHVPAAPGPRASGMMLISVVTG